MGKPLFAGGGALAHHLTDKATRMYPSTIFDGPPPRSGEDPPCPFVPSEVEGRMAPCQHVSTSLDTTGEGAR